MFPTDRAQYGPKREEEDDAIGQMKANKRTTQRLFRVQINMTMRGVVWAFSAGRHAIP